VTFGQLQTFLAVARTGSVRAAAAQLVVTEPAVSAAVSALQRELGFGLVTRQGRGIVLTPAGETLARYAAELIGLRDQALRELRGARTLRLAAVTTAGEYIVPPLLKAFRASHPDVEVSLEVGNRSTVYERLLRRDVDLAIGGQPPRGSGMEGSPFLDYRLAVVSAAHAQVDDPADETWLLREPGSGTRTTVETFLADQGIVPRSTMTLGSNGAIKQAVAVGLGITLLSTHAAGAELAAGTLRRVRVPGAPLRRSWYVLRRTTGTQLPEAAAFGSFCRSSEARAAVLSAIRPASPAPAPPS
jgi:LysR family transcriptional regulator, low CO2-responsive transcriptional regulator